VYVPSGRLAGSRTLTFEPVPLGGTRRPTDALALLVDDMQVAERAEADVLVEADRHRARTGLQARTVEWIAADDVACASAPPASSMPPPRSVRAAG